MVLSSSETDAMSAAFTLSFGGVDFCLTPNIGHVSDVTNAVMSISKVCGSEILINLNNFEGTLRVAPSSILQTNKTSNADSLTATATEELAESNDAIVTNKSAAVVQEVEESSGGNIETSVSNQDLSQKNNVDDVDENQTPRHQRSVTVPEDTPSPELPTKNAISTKKGQQKLNFKAKRNEKFRNRAEVANTAKESKQMQSKSANSKRSTYDDAPSHSAKKTKRKSNDMEKQEDVSNFSNVFLEPKDPASGTMEDHGKTFTLASLGQTMPSQTSSRSLDEPVSKDAEMDSNEESAEGKDQLNEVDAALTTNYSFSMEEFSRDSFAEDFVSYKAEAVYDKGGITMTNAGGTYEMDMTTSSSAKKPKARWGHTMEMIDHKRFIIYGGQTIDPVTHQAKPLADLFVYDILDHTWTEPINCKGVPRTWHTANFLPDRQLLLCFGGDVVDEKTGKMTTTDQVMVLDTDIMLW